MIEDYEALAESLGADLCTSSTEPAPLAYW
jgi:hypothetical protein